MSHLMLAAHHFAVLASGTPTVPGTGTGKGIQDTALWTPIKAIFAAIGTLIVIYVLFRAIKHFTKADFAGGVKVLVGGLVAAALCLDLNIPLSAIGAVSKLISDAISSLTSLIGS